MTAGFIDGLAAIADRYDAFFVDQFGVMHDGQAPYPGAVEAMQRLMAAHRAVVVLTNSGKRAAPNIARVEHLGFPRDSFSTLMSSGEVTWQALRTGAFGPPFGAGRRLFVVGKAGDDYGLHDLDLTAVEDPAAAEFIVIAGSDCPQTDLGHYRALLAPAAERHVPALCANPDRLMLTPQACSPRRRHRQGLPGSRGRVIFAGKPHAAIYAQARKAAGNAGRILCIGDSLEHDIEGGRLAGCDTALVRTGILDGIDDTALQALLDDAPHKPTYVLPGLIW